MTSIEILDTVLITPFQLHGPPEAAFFFGIVVLAVASAALGLACAALVARAQRTRSDREETETQKRHDLSIQALHEGNKTAYLAQNHLAQEAYGNTLAMSAGRAAAVLWPGCVCLTWLYWRFDGVPMPFLWSSAGPANYFLPALVLALWGLARLLPKRKTALNL